GARRPHRHVLLEGRRGVWPGLVSAGAAGSEGRARPHRDARPDPALAGLHRVGLAEGVRAAAGVRRLAGRDPRRRIWRRRRDRDQRAHRMYRLPPRLARHRAGSDRADARVEAPYPAAGTQAAVSLDAQATAAPAQERRRTAEERPDREEPPAHGAAHAGSASGGAGPHPRHPAPRARRPHQRGRGSPHPRTDRRAHLPGKMVRRRTARRHMAGHDPPQWGGPADHVPRH
ncbi:hypothetical protein LTR94_029368, partial [Friedmanniomyces endolithicus]